jgi:mevalonate kinase
MTSNQTRRPFSGKPLKTKTHSRSSSSTTSVQIETPSDTSPSTSPSIELHPRTNGNVNGISADMANTDLNGVRKTKRGLPLDRKQSTPMMPAFMVSAPGKVIVFGEHAVVHGKVCPALFYASGTSNN